MRTAVEIANQMSEDMMDEITQLFDSVYEFLHWWDDPVKEGDDVKVFGFMALIKRK